MLQKKGLVPCAWRAFGVLGGRCFSAWEQWRAKRKSTYLTRVDIDAADFPHFFRMDDPSVIPAEDRETISSLSASFREHRFDLLGSGWIKIFRGMVPEGLMGVAFEPKPVSDSHKPFDVNQANRAEAERIWNLIPKKNYEPIHWHIAYRSGYEWSAKAWRTEPRKNLPRGVDLKEPWELSRMQHLVIMAVDALQKPDLRDEIAEEIESQILDFIANNPPSFGVNWVCTMDVALRASTWLICFDLCRSAGIQFSEGFTKGFGRSIYEHAHFIAHHLEWSDLTRSNHYLFDIIGLVFCSSFLPKSKTVEGWLSFAVGEFLCEVKRQFNSDGTTIECSTAYHCFVAEGVAYTTSLLVSVLKNRGDESYYSYSQSMANSLAKRAGIVCAKPGTLHKYEDVTPSGLSGALHDQFVQMKEFVEGITRVDGTIVQIGDNDSGLFVKLGNNYLSNSGEDGLAFELQDSSRLHIARCMHDFLTAETSTWNSSILPSKLARYQYGDRFPDGRNISQITASSSIASAKHLRKIEFSSRVNLDGLQLYEYPVFGLYILKNESLFVSVRTPSGDGQIVGHHHQDQLSVSISVGTKNIIEDPGIPFYTPFPEMASTYRSEAVHFSPIGFQKNDLQKMNIEGFNNAVTIQAFDKLLLEINIVPDGVEIKSDYPLPDLKKGRYEKIATSPGYGKISGIKDENN